MAFIGNLFRDIGNLFGGQQQQQEPISQTLLQAPKPSAPAQAAPTKPQATGTGTPSFLAAAALPNFGANPAAGAPQSNAGGKSLLGQ